jgi:hypothetical protein
LRGSAAHSLNGQLLRSRAKLPTGPYAPGQTKECLAIWNRDEQRGSGSQVSRTDFLADLAQQRRTPVRVEYSRPSCFVVARIGPRRARALDDGRIAMR